MRLEKVIAVRCIALCTAAFSPVSPPSLKLACFLVGGCHLPQGCQPPEDTRTEVLLSSTPACPTFLLTDKDIRVSVLFPSRVGETCVTTSCCSRDPFLCSFAEAAVLFSDNKPCVLESSTTSWGLELHQWTRKHWSHKASQVKETK